MTPEISPDEVDDEGKEENADDAILQAYRHLPRLFRHTLPNISSLLFNVVVLSLQERR